MVLPLVQAQNCLWLQVPGLELKDVALARVLGPLRRRLGDLAHLPLPACAWAPGSDPQPPSLSWSLVHTRALWTCGVQQLCSRPACRILVAPKSVSSLHSDVCSETRPASAAPREAPCPRLSRSVAPLYSRLGK